MHGDWFSVYIPKHTAKKCIERTNERTSFESKATQIRANNNSQTEIVFQLGVVVVIQQKNYCVYKVNADTHTNLHGVSNFV